MYSFQHLLLAFLAPLCCPAMRQELGGSGEEELRSSWARAQWKVVRGACTASCGEGVQPVFRKVCVEKWLFGDGKVLPDVDCKDAEEPKDKPCKGYDGCEWRRGADPPDSCGFSQAVCWNTESDAAMPDGHWCEENYPMELWRSRNSLVTTGCAALREKGQGLKDICIVSNNYDKGLGLTTYNRRKEPEHILGACNRADVVVVATQELKNKLRNHFKPWVHAASKVKGYSKVAACGGTISPGVVVLVWSEKRRFVAPTPELCQSLDDDDGSKFNTKGTEIGWIQTVLGKLAFASTHAARGDTVAPLRATEVEAAVDAIMKQKPDIVAWGGDLNPRTPGLAGVKELQKLATTHPDGKRAQFDAKYSWLESYDPSAVLEKLAAAPDILGRPGETLDELLLNAHGGAITQAPGIRDLCPTYPKVPDSGKMVNGDGLNNQDLVWKPRFACRAKGGEVEYYMSDMDGKTPFAGKGNKAPSWADRILISGLNCSDARKLISKEDHDTLLVTCKFAP